MASSDDIVSRDDGSWITNDFFQDVIQHIHPDQKVTIVDKDVQLALGKGENYLSKIFRTEVRYKLENSENIEQLYLIVKSCPDGEYMKKMTDEMGVFDREWSMYRDVLPAVYKFAEEKMGPNEVHRFSARAFITSRPNTLVLEDLKYQGFKMANRKNLLDLQHCRLVVNNLARLHAMSVAFNQHHPGILIKYDDVLLGDVNRQNMEKFMPLQMKDLAKSIRSWPGFETYADKIEKMIPGFLTKVYEDTRPLDGGFNVLCHGDCWVNNYLFKYSPTGEVIDVYFIDLQLSRFASPALDLLYFLYTSPQSEVRAVYLEQLLKEYHNQLCKTLTSLGCKSDLFTFENLRKEIRRVARYAYFTSSLVLPIVVADAEETPDMAEITEDDLLKEDMTMWEKTYSNLRFKRTFQQLLPQFDEIGAFD